MYCNDVNTMANGSNIFLKKNNFMENIDNVREYVATKAELERDKKMIEKEMEYFAQEVKNGLGEEMKNELRGQKENKENKLLTFFKKLLNTCQ